MTRIGILLFILCFSPYSLAEGLDGKVMCGYQGWFRTPGDGTNNGWRHYSRGEFKPGNCTIDLWPDVSELPSGEQYPTAFRHTDGTVAKVYSPVNAATVDIHFKWMKDYGIDGVFLQRFVTSTKSRKLLPSLDKVLKNCRSAAQKHGRKWTLTYDLSGLKPGQTDLLIDDWKRLRNELKVGTASDPSYLKHRGKPLITLWGLGFSDRPFVYEEWSKLINFFKNDTEFGGCSVMVGVPSYWRTLGRDSIKDPRLHELMKQVDVISPWSVGRYRTPEGANKFIQKSTASDVAWCKQHGIDYLPTAFPGFSWQNLKKAGGEEAKLNVIPRLEGRFLWSQCWGYKKAGAKSLYIAMFDELDEGTAIFKCNNNPPVGKSSFVSEKSIPNDHYLWLAGKARELFAEKKQSLSHQMPERVAAAVKSPKKPNIVFILSDDQAWTDYGFMGHADIKTPHLDKLAARSLVFERGYVSSPLCRPSLASMATGLYPFEHGVTGNDVDGPNKRAELDVPLRKSFHKHPSFIKLLTSNGYLAHQSGKWWEGSWADGGFTHGMTHGDPKRGGRHGDVGLKIGRTSMKPITDFIDEATKQNKPFLLWYAPFLPHTPHNPPARLLKKYTQPGRAEDVAKYYAMCEWFDETCGELLGYIDKKKLTDNTVVIYICDNGWVAKSENADDPDQKLWKRYALRSKGSPYENGIRTPIMVSWPEQVTPSRSPHLAHAIDIFPTIAAATGLKSPKKLTGINLLDEHARKARKAVYGVTNSIYNMTPGRPDGTLQYLWCVESDWKLLLRYNGEDTTKYKNTHIWDKAPMRLYNLKNDPHETKDLTAKHPEIVKRLIQKIEEWHPVKQNHSPKGESKSSDVTP